MTAAHCFNSGTTASDGTGSRVRQWSSYVGRQHTAAGYVNLDAALVKIMDNALLGGRYATNGIKVVSDDSASEEFDNYFVNAASTSPAFSQVICRVGISTPKTCGRVIQKGFVSNNWENPPFTRIVSVVVPDDWANYSAKGDSGGAIYRPSANGNVLTGIHVGKLENGHPVFTDIIDVFNHYDLFLYTSSTPLKVAD